MGQGRGSGWPCDHLQAESMVKSSGAYEHCPYHTGPEGLPSQLSPLVGEGAPGEWAVLGGKRTVLKGMWEE